MSKTIILFNSNLNAGFLKHLLNADAKAFVLSSYAESTWVGFKLGKRGKVEKG